MNKNFAASVIITGCCHICFLRSSCGSGTLRIGQLGTAF